MADYLATLPPEATAESMFRDLGERTSEVVDGIFGLHEAEHGTLDKTNFGLPITAANLSLGITGGIRMDGSHIDTLDIFTNHNGFDFPLISKTVKDTIERGTHLFRAANPTIRVDAARDSERICGDYSIEIKDTVVGRLGRLGISLPRFLPDEPYGITEIDPCDRIDDLPEIDQARLDTIGDGIKRSVAAVTLLLAGTSAKDVLVLQGRNLDCDNYVHPFSAGSRRLRTLQRRRFCLVNDTETVLDPDVELVRKIINS